MWTVWTVCGLTLRLTLGVTVGPASKLYRPYATPCDCRVVDLGHCDETPRESSSLCKHEHSGISGLSLETIQDKCTFYNACFIVLVLVLVFYSRRPGGRGRRESSRRLCSASLPPQRHPQIPFCALILSTNHKTSYCEAKALSF